MAHSSSHDHAAHVHEGHPHGAGAHPHHGPDHYVKIWLILCVLLVRPQGLFGSPEVARA